MRYNLHLFYPYKYNIGVLNTGINHNFNVENIFYRIAVNCEIYITKLLLRSIFLI